VKGRDGLCARDRDDGISEEVALLPVEKVCGEDMMDEPLVIYAVLSDGAVKRSTARLTGNDVGEAKEPQVGRLLAVGDVADERMEGRLGTCPADGGPENTQIEG
jgi:hypothetical protein